MCNHLEIAAVIEINVYITMSRNIYFNSVENIYDAIHFNVSLNKIEDIS